VANVGASGTRVVPRRLKRFARTGSQGPFVTASCDDSGRPRVGFSRQLADGQPVADKLHIVRIELEWQLWSLAAGPDRKNPSFGANWTFDYDDCIMRADTASTGLRS
jgi:hypothetical protein